jgi:hypothetical protein
MAPKEGNSIVKHGVLDERLNVHGVKHLKVADLSICPDNVGCNTFSVSIKHSCIFDNLAKTYTDRPSHRRESLHARRRGSRLLWRGPGDAHPSVPRSWGDARSRTHLIPRIFSADTHSPHSVVISISDGDVEGDGNMCGMNKLNLMMTTTSRARQPSDHDRYNYL